MKTPFQVLIRFQDREGNIRYGEAPEDVSSDNFEGKEVQVYDGTEPWDLKPTLVTATVAEVRCTGRTSLAKIPLDYQN